MEAADAFAASNEAVSIGRRHMGRQVFDKAVEAYTVWRHLQVHTRMMPHTGHISFQNGLAEMM